MPFGNWSQAFGMKTGYYNCKQALGGNLSANSFLTLAILI
jgi:hypothetical protein